MWLWVKNQETPAEHQNRWHIKRSSAPKNGSTHDHIAILGPLPLAVFGSLSRPTSARRHSTPAATKALRTPPPEKASASRGAAGESASSASRVRLRLVWTCTELPKERWEGSESLLGNSRKGKGIPNLGKKTFWMDAHTQERLVGEFDKANDPGWRVPRLDGVSAQKRKDTLWDAAKNTVRGQTHRRTRLVEGNFKGNWKEVLHVLRELHSSDYATEHPLNVGSH